MTNEKVYTILEIGYEYNDEIYGTGNYGETFEEPTNYYTDSDKVVADKNALEYKKFRGLDIGSYAYDLEDLLSNNTTLEELGKYINETFDLKFNEDDWYDFTIPSKATDEQIQGLMKFIKLRFYKIITLTKK